MGRKPREDVEGVHHVWARGNDRRVIFRDDFDRERYLLLLGKTAARTRWSCLAYCLMDNHVHLLLELREPNLATGMQRLHGLYGLGFNERHGRTGHLFQGRFGSKLVTTDEQLWGAVAYIARNPVEAGLRTSPADWPWCSEGALARGRAPGWLDQARLLHHLEDAGPDPEATYAQLTT